MTGPRDAPPTRKDRGEGGGQGFREREIEEIEAHSAVRPPVLFEVIRREGETEMRRPVSALLLSGLAAGFAIGFSVLSEAALRRGLPDAPWRPLVENLGYSVGFLIVMLGQMQLFTETTITPVASALIRRGRETALGLARVWAAVLIANLAGATLFAAFVLHTPAVPPDVLAPMLEISAKATDGGFRATLASAVPAGWVIAALVWLGPTADGARAFVIVGLTYMIGLAEFSHVIAGSAEIALLLLDGRIGPEAAFGGFLAPALLGNVIGGSALFTLLVWGQIRAELPRADAMEEHDP